MLTIIVILVVSGSLLLGAVWGSFWPFPKRVEGFVVAIAGGALIASAMLELIDPATEHASIWAVAVAVLAGAGVFSILDKLVADRWGDDSGGGLLAAITLDGVPENLALGVALIGVEPKAVAALAGSILLSNLPEAAGGAKEMSSNGMSRSRILGIWGATALLLSLSAIAGYFLLENTPESMLALIRAFAGGAVVASLATEVFPKAFREDSYVAGFATACGLVLAVALDQL